MCAHATAPQELNTANIVLILICANNYFNLMKNIFMKRHLSLLWIMLSVYSFGQYNEKIYENQLSKSSTYDNISTWVSQESIDFRNKEVGVKDDDKNQLIFSLNGYKKNEYTNSIIKVTVKAEIKDNKYRLSTSDPIIIIKPNDRDYTYMSKSTVKEAIGELEAIKRIGTELNGLLEWKYSDLINLKQNKTVLLSAKKAELQKAADKKSIRILNSDISDIEAEIKQLDLVKNSTDEFIEKLYSDISLYGNKNRDF